MARNYLIQERPDAILNIVDGTNLERNLYLTLQLLELEMPMVVALNRMDEVAGIEWPGWSHKGRPFHASCPQWCFEVSTPDPPEQRAEQEPAASLAD